MLREKKGTGDLAHLVGMSRMANVEFWQEEDDVL